MVALITYTEARERFRCIFAHSKKKNLIITNACINYYFSYMAFVWVRHLRYTHAQWKWTDAIQNYERAWSLLWMEAEPAAHRRQSSGLPRTIHFMPPIVLLTAHQSLTLKASAFSFRSMDRSMLLPPTILRELRTMSSGSEMCAEWAKSNQRLLWSAAHQLKKWNEK